jgi:hypothetical protein
MFGNFFKKAKAKLAVFTGLFAVGATQANAALDVSGIALDVGQVEVIGLTIMGALALIWVVRKVISMLR